MSEKVCIITGGTSGIGLATADAMREAGYTVYELSRREKGAEGFFHIPADVTDLNKEYLQSMYHKLGRTLDLWHSS